MKYPEIFIFIEVAYREKSKSIESDLKLINEELTVNNYNKVFENIDTSKFKEGLDIKKCISIIICTIDGFGAQTMKEEKLITSNEEVYETIFAQATIYMDILKKCFYK